jgi:excisionase family DNA binding protein
MFREGRRSIMSTQWLTVAEIARLLQIDEQTVRRWIRAGRLPATNLGGKAGYRIEPNDLQGFLASLRAQEASKALA